MGVPGIIIDTNVLIAALHSKKGSSYRLLTLVGTGKFEIHISVPLTLEYEQVILRYLQMISLSRDDVSAFIDSLCAMAKHHKLYFPWRPYLPDIYDNLLLELAVSAQCNTIVTYHKIDFKGVDEFGINAVLPLEFLKIIGEVQE